MSKEHMIEDLRGLATKIGAWDGEDVCRMYEWMLQMNFIARTLDDDAVFLSIISPHDLPVGSSPAPKNLTNVWTWDNHGRYLVGDRWTADELKIRRLNELDIE